jgi:hypothetical protein
MIVDVYKQAERVTRSSRKESVEILDLLTAGSA